MSKDRITVTVDAENADFLRQDHINASGLVNKLVEQYRTCGADGDQMIDLRIEQVESEYEDAASRARRKLEERNALLDRKRQQQGMAADRREELFAKVRRVPKDPDQPLIHDIADELDMDPEDVVAEAYDE